MASIKELIQTEKNYIENLKAIQPYFNYFEKSKAEASPNGMDKRKFSISDAIRKMSARNEERIRTATDIFDQKVKDKMINLDQAMDEIKYIQQKINERAEENDTFQQEMEQSHENA